MTKAELELSLALENIKALSFSTDVNVADMIHMAASDALFRAKDFAISDEVETKVTSSQQFIQERRAEIEAIMTEFYGVHDLSDASVETWVVLNPHLDYMAIDSSVEGI